MMSEDPASAAAVGGARWLALLRGDVTYRRRFGLLGREWDLFPGVFSPIQSHSTGFFSRAVPQREGGTFLDVGCGSGVMAVEAALAGCREVLAVDLDTVAVDNTRHNARLHGAGAVSAQVSDCFADIPPQLASTRSSGACRMPRFRPTTPPRWTPGPTPSVTSGIAACGPTSAGYAAGSLPAAGPSSASRTWGTTRHWSTPPRRTDGALSCSRRPPASQTRTSNTTCTS